MKKLSLVSLVAIFTLLFSVSVFAAAPGKVTNLHQTSASEDRVDFAWDEVNLDSNTRYEVAMSLNGIDYDVIESSTKYVEKYKNNLKPGKSYYVKVRAFNSSDKKYGPFSDALEVVTRPEEVTNVQETAATTNSATISWTGSEGAMRYDIYKVANDTFTLAGSTKDTKYTLTGLSNVKEVPFTIVIKPVRYTATFTAQETSKYTFDYGRLSAGDIKLTPKKMANPMITTHWTHIKEVKAEFEKTPFASGYQYEVYNAKGQKISTGSGTTYYLYITGISRRSFYKVRARAFLTLGGKSYSGAWSDYTWFANSPEMAGKHLKKKLSIKINKVAGASKYEVYVSTNSGAGFKKVATTKKTSIIVKKLGKKKITKKKDYYVKVYAVKMVGKKKYSSTSEILSLYKPY